MTKRPPEAPVIYQPTSITATDGKVYAIDDVREAFINSEGNIEELALQLNIPPKTIEAYARHGLKSWFKMKQDKLENRMQYFLDVNIDNLMETHSVLEEGHLLQIIQMKGTQDFLKHYYLKHGHLFLVDSEEQIAVDAYGMPIPLPLPTGPKQLMALDGLLKLKDGTKKEMNLIHDQIKESRKKQDIRVDDLDIFIESVDEPST